MAIFLDNCDHTLAKKNTTITIISIIAILILAIISCVSLFLMPSFRYLYKYIITIHYGFIAIVLLVTVTVVLIIRDFWFLYLRHMKICLPSRKKIWTVFLLTISFPITFMGFSYGLPTYTSGDKTAQLLLLDTVGDFGVNNIGLSFYTKKPSQNMVMWGNSTHTFEISEEKMQQSHFFIFDQLLPNASYWYRINDASIANFSTPSIDQLSVTILTDTHFLSGYDFQYSKKISTLSNIYGNSTNYIIHLGDIVDYGCSDKQWEVALKAMSVCTATIPIKYLSGNHDALFNGDILFTKYIGDHYRSKKCYGMNSFGNVHFIYLQLEWDSDTYTLDQQLWLESTLATLDPNDFIVVFTHAPIYSSDVIQFGNPMVTSYESIATFAPLFQLRGVDLVFSGHMHHMEVINQTGTYYNIVGAFNEANSKVTHVQQQSMWREMYTEGYCTLNINTTHATTTFLGRNGTTLYQYNIEKK